VTAVVADVPASSGTDLKRAEVLSVPVTLLVLLLAFGAIVAALEFRRAVRERPLGTRDPAHDRLPRPLDARDRGRDRRQPRAAGPAARGEATGDARGGAGDRSPAVQGRHRPQRGRIAIEMPLTGLGANDASRHAIAVLRDDLIPATLGKVHGIQTAVTRDTAHDVDFTTQMKDGIPYVIAFVLGLAFLLLLVTFGSVVMPPEEA
jgi:hypothetical protein